MSATMLDVMNPQTLNPDAVRNLARALGMDGALVRPFDAGGPMHGTAPAQPMWFLATCHRCGEDMAEPLVEAHARDSWAIAHVTATEHAVILSVDPGPRTSVVLRFGADLWSWLCTGCAATGRPTGAAGGGFESGQLALAAYRRHVCEHA